ncbi:MAG: phage holin family protein [Atopobiaceae bacterium]|nr:phage holin family protein [Atopobiaceae bacterium]
MLPEYLDVFIAPIRDSSVAKVLLVAVMLLTFADIVFGVLNALIHHDFQSSKMREGIAHKSTTAGAILVGCVIDGTITAGVDLGYPAPVLAAICGYIILMEIASLLETFGKLNPQFQGSPIYQLLAAAHVVAESECEPV